MAIKRKLRRRSLSLTLSHRSRSSSPVSSTRSPSPRTAAPDHRHSLDLIDFDETPRPSARHFVPAPHSFRDYLSDKLSTGAAIVRAPANLLPARSGHHHQQPQQPQPQHARADSDGNKDKDVQSQLMAASGPKQTHPSPSKASIRTYDQSLVSREMHRLGTLGTLAPTPGASASSLSLASSTTLVPSISSSMSGDNPWSSLHVLVLPLFNSEPLRVPIEDLNALVRKHIKIVVGNSPARAVSTLETQTSDLISSGMDTFNGKLAGVPDDKLVGRVVELWGFFWDQVLPYVEGVLLPLQTDQILSSLYRLPKSHRTSSPTRTSAQSNGTGAPAAQIDVRTLALRCFRDGVILPIFSRLHARIALQKQEGVIEGHTFPRLQQMLLVLISQARQPTVSNSLTDATTPPAQHPGEAAVAHLLRVVRAPPMTKTERLARAAVQPGRPFSFLSGAVPRDRRGRISRRTRGGSGDGQGSGGAGAGAGGSSGNLGTGAVSGGRGGSGGRAGGGRGSRLGGASVDDSTPEGDETPRTGFARRPFDNHFKTSSDRESDGPSTNAGGWGLGDGGWEGEEDDDDWDGEQLQAHVERMVGMKPAASSAAGAGGGADSPARPTETVRPEAGRRRMT